MRGSLLRTPIEIQARVSGKDDYGQVIDQWTTRASAYADVRYLSGSQSIRNLVDTTSVRASVRIRYIPDLMAGMRIKTPDGYLMVQAVMVDAARREYVDLVCEGVANES